MLVFIKKQLILDIKGQHLKLCKNTYSSNYNGFTCFNLLYFLQTSVNN